jgi:hypothetical protein
VRRWLVAIASGLACAAPVGSARAERFFDPTNAIDRPLTLPAHELSVFTGGVARHLETGEVVTTSTLGAAYGFTDRFEVELDAVNAEYTPTTRLLGPGATATYAFFDHVVQMGARLTVAGVIVPSPGGLLQPALPIRIPVGSRVRVDLGPQFPIVLNQHPIVGVVAPFGVTVHVFDTVFAHFDTAASLADVTAHSIVVPAKLTVEIGLHVRKLPLTFTPFFAFPTLITPGDEHPHWHPKDYAGGLGIGTWFRL